MKGNFRKNIPLLVLIGLLLPLFYINVKDSHDWGDDFAQYFIQARNILDGRPQADNGLVFDQQTGEYALQAYPVGFPLILAAAWYFFGQSMLVSSMTLSFFYFAFGIVCYLFFRRKFPAIVSVLLVLVIIYNPLMTGFKKEILSDVPFSFFLISGMLLFTSKKKDTLLYVFTGLVWGFALSVRGIGAALLVTAVLTLAMQGVQFSRRRLTRGELLVDIRKTMTVSASALLFYFLLNGILFPVPSGSILRFYAEAVKDEPVGKWMLLNLKYYYDVLLNFFSAVGGSWHWLASFTKHALLLLAFTGLIVSWLKSEASEKFENWLFLVYLLVLFVYPYTGGGFRFLLPILPILLKYAFTAVHEVSKRFRFALVVPAALFLSVILLQYIPGTREQLRTMPMPEQGPEEWQASEAFEHIKLLPEDAVVVFLKPRALSYYSGKKSAYVVRSTTQEALPELFARMNAHYFLLCNENDEVFDRLLTRFIKENKDRLRIVFKNEYFELYSDI